ncbi:AraC family transcriptional regulator [Marivirga sp. S37H4]|uniref:AraC family transcriptional regulator n=1 Tax=Marivirga aurantiaca TaxID=2802615 RepID=A0A934WZJ9_9BACT|nr:helix-turn-helix domain-containing protein [Marivirga aurantiaca]MBK6265655.1 AraC family transcriptional regulator [Marivirga aurantiaca]
MDFEQIIFLIIAGQGILLSLALISSIIKNNYSNLFLGLITLVISLEILTAWAIQGGHHTSDVFFPYWTLGSYLILPPATFLFSKANTQTKFYLKAWHFLIFLPAIIEVMTELVVFYFNRFANTNYRLLTSEIWYLFTEILPLMGMAMVLIIYGKDLKSVINKLKELPPKDSSAHIIKLWFIFIPFILLTILWFFDSVLNYPVYPAIQIILSLLLFALAYIGYFNPSFFTIPATLSKKTFKEEFSHYDDEKELKKLADIFSHKKIFTRSKLTLEELANELELPPRYLSGLIKTYHGSDFRKFVNSYRVNEVIAQIKEGQADNKTLLAIAMDSGFNSKSSFNETFKNLTGKNPSDYLKEP